MTKYHPFFGKLHPLLSEDYCTEEPFYSRRYVCHDIVWYVQGQINRHTSYRAIGNWDDKSIRFSLSKIIITPDKNRKKLYAEKH